MPTYVYECRTCADVFEVEQRMTEEPLRDCRCGAKGALRRVIQPVGVVFNGAGFHINDYSSPSKGSSAKEEVAAKGDVPCAPEGCPRCTPEASP